MSSPPTTLFDKYGGVAGVRKIVTEFYSGIMVDPALRRYFTNVNLVNLIEHQVNFICHLMGKPAYEDPEGMLERVHKGKRIPETVFVEVVSVLRRVLVDNQMEPQDVSTVVATVHGYKSKIVELPLVQRTHKPG